MIKLDQTELKKIRLMNNLTQLQASKLVGVCLRTWAYWESNSRKMKDAYKEIFMNRISEL